MNGFGQSPLAQGTQGVRHHVAWLLYTPNANFSPVVVVFYEPGFHRRFPWISAMAPKDSLFLYHKDEVGQHATENNCVRYDSTNIGEKRESYTTELHHSTQDECTIEERSKYKEGITSQEKALLQDRADTKNSSCEEFSQIPFPSKRE